MILQWWSAIEANSTRRVCLSFFYTVKAWISDPETVCYSPDFSLSPSLSLLAIRMRIDFTLRLDWLLIGSWRHYHSWFTSADLLAVKHFVCWLWHAAIKIESADLNMANGPREKLLADSLKRNEVSRASRSTVAAAVVSESSGTVSTSTRPD